MAGEQESTGFEDYLAAAEEYEGWGDEETSDEGSPEGTQDDAGDEGLGDEGEYEPDATEAGTESDEPTFEVTLPGGEKANVPLSELMAGYSRTADYTRKTQALAAERRSLADAAAIAQALERNPAAAIEALAKAYGVGNAQPAQDEYVDPDEQWRQQVNARFEAQDRAQREAAIDAEVRRLHDVYGNFDEEALFTHAVQTGTMNLEIALQAMHFQEMRERNAQNGQRQAQARQAKRAAAAAPPTGRGTNGSAPVVEDGEITSFQDAYKYAKRRLNRS